MAVALESLESLDPLKSKTEDKNCFKTGRKLGMAVASKLFKNKGSSPMLSIEKRHPVYSESCHCLRPGQSAYSQVAEIPFDLHRYKDGWHVYWKNPPNGKIGRFLRTRAQLNSFLAGNWRMGAVILSPTSAGLSSKRFSSRRK